MPTAPNDRPPLPLAAAVMLGLVLGIFGYILYLAVSFRRPPGEVIVFLPILCLAPIGGVLARFAWPSWRTVAACVALPTAFWSLLASGVAAYDHEPGAIAHLIVAAAAIACALVGAFIGRRLATSPDAD